MAQRVIDSDTTEATATTAALEPCSFCGRGPKRRRGLCWTCNRKLRECAQAMPPDGRLAEPLAATLTRWLASWTPDARARLVGLLEHLP